MPSSDVFLRAIVPVGVSILIYAATVSAFSTPVIKSCRFGSPYAISFALLLTVGTLFLVAVIRTEPLTAFSDVMVSLLPDFDTVTLLSELVKV